MSNMSNMGVGHVLAEGHVATSCATCRRKAHMIAIGLGRADVLHVQAYERLIAHFEKFEPTVAHAIRYGFKPGDRVEGVLSAVINYPE